MRRLPFRDGTFDAVVCADNALPPADSKIVAEPSGACASANDESGMMSAVISSHGADLPTSTG